MSDGIRSSWLQFVKPKRVRLRLSTGRRTLLAFTVAAFVWTVPAVAQPRATTSPIFVFHADDFWLNLHHFLYVLGRHEARMPDRTRRATAGAPGDAEKGLANLTPDEQQTWREAVSFYARGPSRQDAVFDAPMVKVGEALARAAGAPSLGGAGVDPAIAAVLEKAAPIYRKAWWPAHRQANETWITATGQLVEKHGGGVLSFITRAYGDAWPAAGYPVHITGYTNWAGAFSTGDNLLLMSSLDEGNRGLTGLEIAFHEAMHQWDTPMDGVLSAQAKKAGVPVPDLLSHALVFYTAGEAVRSVVSTHVPYAESNGLWRQGGLGAFKPALDEVWKPYLEGKGTRDEAIAELLKRAVK